MKQFVIHPLARDRRYSVDDDGSIRIEAVDGIGPDATVARAGRFDDNGHWLDGEVRTADPQMCRYMFAHWRLTNVATAPASEGTDA